MGSSLLFAAALIATALPHMLQASSCDGNSENCANVEHAKSTTGLHTSTTPSQFNSEQREAAAASSNALGFSHLQSYHPQAADKPVPFTDLMHNASAPRALLGCVAPTSLGTGSCPSSAFACNSVDLSVYEEVIYAVQPFVPTGSPAPTSSVVLWVLWRHRTSGVLYLPLPRRARNRAFADWTSGTLPGTSNIASQLGSISHGCANYWVLTFFRAVKFTPGVQGSYPAQIQTNDRAFAEMCYPKDGPGLGQNTAWCRGLSVGGGTYGSAGACNGDTGLRGVASVDLLDTPFSVQGTAGTTTSRSEGMLSFLSGSGLATYQSGGLTDASLTSGNKLLALRSGGWCGEVYGDRSTLTLREVAVPWQAPAVSASGTPSPTPTRTRSPTSTVTPTVTPTRSVPGTVTPSSSSTPSQGTVSARPSSSPSSTRLPNQGPPLGTVLSFSQPVSGSGMSRGEYRLYTFTIPSQVFTITLENIVADADLYVFTNREAAQSYVLSSGGSSPTLSSVNGGSDFATITPGERGFRAGASAYIAVRAFSTAPSFWLRVDLGSGARYGNGMLPAPQNTGSSTPTSTPPPSGAIVGIACAVCVGLVGLFVAYKKATQRQGIPVVAAVSSTAGGPPTPSARSGSAPATARGAHSDAFNGLNPMVRSPAFMAAGMPAGMYAGMPAPMPLPSGMSMPMPMPMPSPGGHSTYPPSGQSMYPPSGQSMYPPAWNPALMPMYPGGGMQMGSPQGYPGGMMFPPPGVGSPTPQPVPGSMPTPSPFMYTMGVLPPPAPAGPGPAALHMPVPTVQEYHPQEEARRRERADSDPPADKSCAVCLDNEKDTAFGCGHQACHVCAKQLTSCHICRQRIEHRIRLYG